MYSNQKIIESKPLISLPIYEFNMAHSIQEEHPLHEQPRQSLDTTEKPSEVQEDESQFPKGAKLVAIVISILFAMFLVALV